MYVAKGLVGFNVERGVKRLISQATPHSWGKESHVTRKNCWFAMKDRNRKQSVVNAIHEDGWDMFSVPVGVCLDKYFATDATPIWHGWQYAIDITTIARDKELDKKFLNLSRLQHLQVVGGIDATAVWFVEQDDLPSLARVKEILKRMTRQDSFVGVYYL